MTRVREQSVSAAYHLANRIKVISWALAGHAAALGQMSNELYRAGGVHVSGDGCHLTEWAAGGYWSPLGPHPDLSKRA